MGERDLSSEYCWIPAPSFRLIFVFLSRHFRPKEGFRNKDILMKVKRQCSDFVPGRSWFLDPYLDLYL